MAGSVQSLWRGEPVKVGSLLAKRYQSCEQRRSCFEIDACSLRSPGKSDVLSIVGKAGECILSPSAKRHHMHFRPEAFACRQLSWRSGAPKRCRNKICGEKVTYQEKRENAADSTTATLYYLLLPAREA